MKRLFVIMSAILLFGGQAYGLSASHTIGFDESDFTFEEENGYDVVSHNDCVRYGPEGAPQVLTTSLNFIIPRGMDAAFIAISYTSSKMFKGKYLLFPTQPDDYYALCCFPDSIPWVDPDPKYYKSQNPYPSQTVSLAGTGFFDGANHIATVNIFPIYYIASDSTLYYYSQIDFTIFLSGPSGDTPIFVEIRMRTDQKVYDRLLEDMVENPQDISLYGYKPPLSDTSIAFTMPGYQSYPFLIITRDTLSQYWAPFLEWLNRKGKRAGLVTMEDIVSGPWSDDPEIDDQADMLRAYLKSAYRHGTVWVILGGTADPFIHGFIENDPVVIPTRYVIDDNPPDDEVDCWWHDRGAWKAAEIYFSEFNEDWEVNGDGIPGQRDDDLGNRLENEEELFLGRLPVLNGTDIEIWTQKILNYEQNPGNGYYNYLFEAYWSLADQCNHEEEIVIDYIPSNFTHFIQREEPNGYTWNPTGPSGDLVIEQMSQYPGFINWHHHGDYFDCNVRTRGHNQRGEGETYLNHITTGHNLSCYYNDIACSMDDLTNVNLPGFIFSTDCENADFACAYIEEFEAPGPPDHCIGSNYLFTPSGGGVGFIGTSRYGWVGGSARKERYFLEYVFDPDGGIDDHKIGPAKVNMNSRTPPTGIKYLMNWTVIGSPEQLIWSDTPQHLVVQPDYLNDAVTVTSGGLPVAEAVVCFSSRDLAKYVIDTTDVNGYAQVDLGPGYDFDVTIETNITVTKHNYIPYQIIGAGDIEMDMVWRGDIAFYGIVEIPAGKSLLIKPGTTVRTDSEIIVFGDLEIEGDANHHVILTSAEETPEAGDWSGITIGLGGSLDMSYCDLTYPYNGIAASGASSFLVRYSTIKQWTLYGIQCTDVSEPTIEFCLFEFGGLKAIDIIGGRPVISSNKIIGTDFAITYQGDDTVRIEANILEGLLTSQTGIKVTRYDVEDAPIPYVVNNIDTLYNYGMLLLYCPDDPAVVIKGNEVRKHRFAGVVLNGDAPIIGGTYASGEYNQFSDNDKWGIWVGNGSPVIRENAIKRNGQYAIRAFLSANPNLGDETTPGNNSIWGYIYDGHNSSLNTIMAVGNWWNTTGIPNVYGNWNTSDPLSFDPYLWAKPETELSEIPKEFKLNVNYPNPFNPATTISFDLPKPQTVKIEIFNLLGQKVITLTDFLFDAGVHSVTWDGRDSKGTEVGSGIYFYRFSSEDYMDSKKMTLIK